MFINNNYYIIVLLLLLVNCDNSKKISNQNYNKELEWFTDEENYKNIKAYQDKFQIKYDNCIKAGEYEKAKLLLYHFNAILYDIYSSDSISIRTTKSFINQNYPVKKDSTFVMLNLFLCDQNTTLNNYDECIKYANKTIELNKKLKNATINNKINNLLGIVYVSINKPEKALEHLTSILKYNEDTKNYSGLGVIYYNIADAYSMLCAENESQKFYIKATENFRKAKDTSYYISLKSNLILNQFEKYNDTINAMKSIDTFYKEFKNFKLSKEIDSSYLNEINYLKYFLKSDYDSAFFYNNKVIKYYQKNNNDFSLTSFKLRNSKIHFQKYRKLENESEIIKMADFFVSENNFYESLDLYNLLYENSKINHNFEKSLKYLEKEVELNNLIVQKNLKGQLFEYEKKYESEKKENKIAQQETIISKNKFLITSLISVLAIVILITIIYFFRKKKKEAQAKAKHQEQFTFELLQNTEEERGRIAGELHDSVNHDLLNIKNNLINGKAIAIEDVASIIEEVRNISRNLHPAVFDKIGFEASIENLCERATETGLFTTCEINYNNQLSRNKELQMYRIIQEALNNTLKHGKANAAKVILNTENNNLYLEIKDNGTGFDVETQIKNPKSFGLQSILQRAKAITAKININSSNKGTIILLKIPI